jgi:uncharacterized membrane protein
VAQHTALDRWFLRLWLAGFIAIVVAYIVAYYYVQATACQQRQLPVELWDICTRWS